MYMEDILKDLRTKFNPMPTSVNISFNGKEATVYIDGVYFSTYNIGI